MSKRKKLTQPQWHALHVVYGWDARCPSLGTMRSLVGKGLVQERDDPDRPYEMSAKGMTFRANVLLDHWSGKDVSDRIDYATGN